MYSIEYEYNPYFNDSGTNTNHRNPDLNQRNDDDFTVPRINKEIF
jgi:hypothetical protein